MSAWVDFRAVKEVVSLGAVLRHYQVNGLRRRRRNQLEGCCPIHRGERDDAFHVDLAKNLFHCFACQAGGNVLDFVAAMEHCSIREAALKLQARFGSPQRGQPPAPRSLMPAGTQEGELVREKLGGNPPLRFALSEVDSSHPYLSQRGVDPATAREFGVGFYAREGLLQGRVVIPIRNARGELVAYAGRAVVGRTPKYKLPSGFRKGLELFNLHRAAETGNKTVVVVEGYFDCLRVHQAGFPCVVALMGCALSTRQERMLLDRFERVVLMLDGDAAGRTASRALNARLSRQCRVSVIEIPDGAQPDQLTPATISRLLQDPVEGRPGRSESIETRGQE
jgi:DNA primase